MSILHNGIRKFGMIFFLWGMVVAPCLPVQAQFEADQGIKFSHWKEPVDGLENYRWLSDTEVLYPRHVPSNYQFVKWNVGTGAEQELPGFTKLVRESRHNSNLVPLIFPSPNEKEVAWGGQDDFGNETLCISSIAGTDLNAYVYPMGIHYPSWSEDSRTCFGVIEGVTPRDGIGFTQISAINRNVPFDIKSYPISEGTLMGSRDRGHLGLSHIHFTNSREVSLITRNHDYNQIWQIEEYRLTDGPKLVATHLVELPYMHTLVINEVMSPKGDFIAWRFRNEDAAEIWLSNGQGKHMVRLGKFLRPDTALPGFGFDVSELRWLPSGKGISFWEAGELYVVYPDARLQLN